MSQAQGKGSEGKGSEEKVAFTPKVTDMQLNWGLILAGFFMYVKGKPLPPEKNPNGFYMCTNDKIIPMLIGFEKSLTGSAWRGALDLLLEDMWMTIITIARLNTYPEASAIPYISLVVSIASGLYAFYKLFIAVWYCYSHRCDCGIIEEVP